MIPRLRRTVLGLTLVATLAGVAGAQGPAGELAGTRDGAPVWVRASVEPEVVKLGQTVTYRGRATITSEIPVKWLLPEPDSTVTWGRLVPRIARGRSPAGANLTDTLLVEAPLQVFHTGVVTIPGLRFQFQDPVHPDTYRLPAVHLVVTSVLTPADSNADLRPLRGPLAAPWWERVPWAWVVLALLVVAIVVTLIVRRRRRRPAVVPLPVTAAARPRRDPAVEALAALAALRAKQLPERGRFDEHALELSDIARRFLEATEMTPRPSDTTPELLRHLENTGLEAEDVQRIALLLRAWDRLKFARARSTAEEARREEAAVEALARRRSGPPAERVA